MRPVKRGEMQQRGYTLLELVIVLSLIAIMSGVAVANLRQLQDPVKTGASQLSGFIKQVRSRAMSATQAYLIRPASANRVIALRASVCSAETWQPDSRLVLDLPSGVSLQATDWEVCYGSRGLPDDNVRIGISDLDSRQQEVEVLLGGSVRINQ